MKIVYFHRGGDGTFLSLLKCALSGTKEGFLFISSC